VALAIASLALLASACGSTAIPELPSGLLEATPAVSDAPVDSAAPGAAGSPGPTSAADLALTVMDNVRSFAGDATSYRVAFKGVSRHTTAILKVKGTLNVDGADASIDVTFDYSGPGLARSRYRRVGGDDWVKFDRQAWKPLKGVAATATVDPFSGAIDGSRMQYLGPVKDEPGHHTVLTSGMYLHPALIPANNLTAEKVRRTKLTLVVAEDGTPIRATWNLRGQGRVSGQLQAIAIDLELTYSRFGEPVTIRKP